MSLSLRKKTRQRLIPLLAIPLVFGVLTYWNTRRLQETSDGITHTQQVLLHFEDFLSAVKNCEAAQRGYLLTQQWEFHKAYEEARVGLAADYDKVMDLTIDNRAQQANLQRLRQMVDTRLATLQKGIDSHTAAYLPLGEQQMKQIQEQARIIQNEEERLLSERVLAQQHVNTQANFVYVVGSLLTFGIVLSLYRQVLRYTAQRLRAEEQLAGMNADLEQRVEERTAELSASNKELARSNNDLERFAYAASHDLQEPLRTVNLYAQLLARRYSGRLDSDADDYLRFVETGAKRMLELVDNLLDYSRVIQSEQTPQDIDSESVLDEVMHMLRERLDACGARVIRDALPTVAAKRQEFVQVFQQLLRNAVLYRRAEPLVIRVSSQELPDEWQFSVSDNGMGIPPEYHSEVFVIFKRLGRAQPGSGVGLALCKRIVEKHGGRIWLQSQQSVGSTFFFTVPKQLPVAQEDRSIAS
ncbi:MAG TPA: ATP-binding protein [Bryobacteraceae bacterium]|nr:ATP-binding protein [Bryobacteraceae bacterium]